MSFFTYQEATLQLATARSEAAGKPLANNTRLLKRGDDRLAVKLHNTDVVVLTADGNYELYSGGYKTVTTLDRIRNFSPAKLFSVKGEWYVELTPDPDDPEPKWHQSPRTLPKPYEALNPGPEPERSPEYHYDDPYYLWSSQMHGKNGYATYVELMEKYGSKEAWQEAYLTSFRERRQWLKDRREWDARNRIVFYEGIVVNSEGYVERKRKGGPSKAKLAKHERKVAKVKQQIDNFVKNAVKTLEAGGMPMPSNGDCWYCALSAHDGVPLGDAVDTLYPDGSVKAQANHEHLWSHIEDKYYVPSLFVNALRERGYRDVGIYIHLGMNQDTQTMGGERIFKDSITRDLRRYLNKRLIPAAPTK